MAAPRDPSSAVKKTVLNPIHRALGAVTTVFGEWEMPLWYPAGAVREHLAVVTGAGLFDTSHMDVVLISGSGGRTLLNYAFSRDLSALKPNRALYGVFLDDAGRCIDDAVLYPLGPDRFGLVVNAGMGKRIIAHLAAMPLAAGVGISEPAERLAKLDIQGPASPKIVESILADPGILGSFPYFSFQGDFDRERSRVKLAGGTPALLSRSGYTGEIGFELFIPLDAAAAAWNAIIAAGEARGILPCGLAARDSLRTGAALPLSHQDIGPWPFINNPWSFALPFAPDGGFSKDFNGAAALDPGKADHTLAFVGFDQRRVDPHDGIVVHRGEAVGSILTIVSDMAIGRMEGKVIGIATPGRPDGWKPRGLACGFVKTKRRLDPGEIIALRDKRREIEAVIADDIRPNRTARAKLATFLERA